MLEKLIADIRNADLYCYNDEASTKQGLILPILNALSWNPFNLFEVKPEYGIENKKVDFALLVNNSPKVFIEAKKATENLEKHEDQLLNYSFKHGVPLAILTNGLNWYFYLPSAEGSWKNRRFYSINLKQQDIKEVAISFTTLLEKSNIVSGCAFEKAKKRFESKIKAKKISKYLPEAWVKILQEPDELLLEILADKTEQMCGYKPESSMISSFLQKKYNELESVQNSTPKKHKSNMNFKEADEKHRRKPFKKVSQKDLIPSILEILKQNNGKALKPYVEKEMFNRFNKMFSQAHYQEPVGEGIPRWKKDVQFARNKARELGLIKSPAVSGNGIWELSKDGWHYVGE